MKKAILFFCVLIIVSGISFAADFTQGPACVKPGSFLLSGGFDLGYATAYSGWPFGNITTTIYGFTLVADFALPFFGLTVGAETGYSGGSKDKFDFGVIPLMGRIGYHPDLGVNNLDLYTLGKIGTVLGISDGDNSLGWGIGFGIGGRYFFIDNFGAFTEIGLDGYFFRVSGIHITGRKIFTIGVTYKI
jgi:hypothetical protein